VPLALAPKCEGLMLYDRFQPAHEIDLARRRRLRQQDLETPLVGVLGVVEVGGVASRRPKNLAAAAPD
jgi:hypothetical protein